MYFEAYIRRLGGISFSVCILMLLLDRPVMVYNEIIVTLLSERQVGSGEQ